MTIYDFTTNLDRRHTNSIKWRVKDGELPLTIADMDFRVAPEIEAAMQAKVARGNFGYEYAPDEYFTAVASWYQQEHGGDVDPTWMQYVSGVIPALTACLNYFTAPGDGIVMLEPIYNSFFGAIEKTGRKVVASQQDYDRENHAYQINWADLEEKLADTKTRMFIICNPHNPTGMVWSKMDLERMIRLANQYGVLVVADEIHGDLVIEGEDYTPTFSLDPIILSNVITLVSTSKTFNLASLQAATAIIANPLLRSRFAQAANRQGIVGPNPLAIPASIAAYENGGEWVHQLKALIKHHRQLVQQVLATDLPELSLVPGRGTYLVWLDTQAVTEDSRALVAFLREQTGLLLTPGTEYRGNGKGFVRANLAYPTTVIEDALARLVRGVKAYQAQK